MERAFDTLSLTQATGKEWFWYLKRFLIACLYRGGSYKECLGKEREGAFFKRGRRCQWIGHEVQETAEHSRSSQRRDMSIGITQGCEQRNASNQYVSILALL
jgi:hypothetical protein